MSKGAKKPASDPPAPQAAHEFMEALLAQVQSSRTSEAVDAAQEIVFDAWECPDPAERIRLARKALKISADCADAYTLLAQELATTPHEAVELYSQAVAAGERALGPAAFREDVGMFWGLVETRPYMRARLALAMSLWEAGRDQEATSHAEAMLQLNPSDAQGVRYILLNWLQQQGKDDEADALLQRYKEDDGAEWRWSAALAAFRRQGDSEASRKALARAHRANRHVAAFLVGRKTPPVLETDYISAGGDDEAASYVEATAPAWRMTPGALTWVASVLVPEPGKRPATKRPAPRR